MLIHIMANHGQDWIQFPSNWHSKRIGHLFGSLPVGPTECSSHTYLSYLDYMRNVDSQESEQDDSDDDHPDDDDSDDNDSDDNSKQFTFLVQDLHSADDDTPMFLSAPLLITVLTRMTLLQYVTPLLGAWIENVCVWIENRNLHRCTLHGSPDDRHPNCFICHNCSDYALIEHSSHDHYCQTRFTMDLIVASRNSRDYTLPSSVPTSDQIRLVDDSISVTYPQPLATVSTLALVTRLHAATNSVDLVTDAHDPQSLATRYTLNLILSYDTSSNVPNPVPSVHFSSRENSLCAANTMTLVLRSLQPTVTVSSPRCHNRQDILIGSLHVSDLPTFNPMLQLHSASDDQPMFFSVQLLSTTMQRIRLSMILREWQRSTADKHWNMLSVKFILQSALEEYDLGVSAAIKHWYNSCATDVWKRSAEGVNTSLALATLQSQMIFIRSRSTVTLWNEN